MATTIEMRTCRTIGHSWDAYDADKPDRSTYRIILRCVRCSTTRIDQFQRNTGSLLNRYYNYAEGYRDALISAGTRDDKRLWLYKELGYAGVATVTPIKKKRRSA